MFMERQGTFSRSVGDFLYKVYAWMGIALGLTAVTAVSVASSPSLFRAFIGNKFAFYGIIIAQIAIVFGVSFRLHALQFSTAAMLLAIYSVLVGITTSVIFAVFQLPSIAQIFIASAAMFVTMALYGYYTKADLSSFGSIMTMGLIGLVVASVINLFWANSTFEYVISFFGVIIFTALTAYDSYRIKQLAWELHSSEEERKKVALIGALMLYLDFINLFMYMLQFLGKRRD